jgi:hypothetical protein
MNKDKSRDEQSKSRQNGSHKKCEDSNIGTIEKKESHELKELLGSKIILENNKSKLSTANLETEATVHFQEPNLTVCSFTFTLPGHVEGKIRK